MLIKCAIHITAEEGRVILCKLTKGRVKNFVCQCGLLPSRGGGPPPSQPLIVIFYSFLTLNFTSWMLNLGRNYGAGTISLIYFVL